MPAGVGAGEHLPVQAHLAVENTAAAGGPQALRRAFYIPHFSNPSFVYLRYRNYYIYRCTVYAGAMVTYDVMW